MLSLSNASFPSFGWPSADILQSNNINNTNDTYNDNELLIFRELLESSSHSHSPHQPQQYSEPFSSPEASGDHHHTSPNMVMKKKQNHNANERDRRMKISSLYTTLRSLLPDSDQTKKLSIPGTVAQVVKYIPELQKEVKKMHQKKEELLSVKSNNQKDQIRGPQRKQEARGSVMRSSLISVSATSVATNKKVLVQFSTSKFNQSLMSKVLEKLEDDGLCLLNASSYESGDNIFHSLHLQVHGTLQYDVDAIPQRLLQFATAA